MDKILKNIDSKVTEVRSLNHQVTNMMKMLETQVTQLAGHFTGNDEKLSRQSRNPESAKAIQTCLGKETEDPERPVGARKPKPVAEAEMTSKEKTPTLALEIETEELEFEIVDQNDMKILLGKPHHHLVPTYSRYFKDILTNKREIPKFTTNHIKMIEECSAMIANQAPEKKRDPGCPTIPCSIGVLMFGWALCDLGTSVSVMPKTVFEMLRLPEREPTTICLELAVRYPEGIAEDLPMKIGNHFVLVNFVILEMGEGAKSPLIQGRPFLKTARANIEVGKGEMKFDINGTMSAFKFRPCFEVCTMVSSKYILPHHHVKPKEKNKKAKRKETRASCYRPEEGRMLACEDQKDSQAYAYIETKGGEEVGAEDCNANTERWSEVKN
ncbi:uncharacterized protein LOC101768002 [Setaria italica]|uniref:uncharacterized protein LOC101768002 n=1 Tax=Setaria italica TaxID=4555 RepID=UPI0003511288|nr:uncharacterized protein LOC101768002 [Setaria italica]